MTETELEDDIDSADDLPEPEYVGWKQIDEIGTDGDNPNDMSDEEFEALKQNIAEYGFVVPIITDDEFTVADGEHRLHAAQDLGLEEVWTVALDVDDVDRRVIRQVMNKLRGDHDLYDDAAEFDRIIESGRVSPEDLSDQIARSEDSIERLVETVTESEDGDDGSSGPTDADAALDGLSGDSEDGDEPETIDPDDIETDHECPRCGYEW